MVIESLLCPLGYILTTAMDGDEALHLIESRDFLPDLVLLDVQMFEKTGYEVKCSPKVLIVSPTELCAITTGV